MIAPPDVDSVPEVYAAVIHPIIPGSGCWGERHLNDSDAERDLGEYLAELKWMVG